MEAGYKCANPVCRHILTLELHHILWVKECGGNGVSNLLALCPNCHSMHTAGHIPRSAVKTWKSLLTALNNPNRNTADLLLFLYNEEKSPASANGAEPRSRPFEVSSDGLLLLAGLVVSGLIDKKDSDPDDGTPRYRLVGAGGMPTYHVNLTEKGRRIVDAWLSGNPDMVRDAFGAEKPE
jgi:hypothetical protein